MILVINSNFPFVHNICYVYIVVSKKDHNHMHNAYFIDIFSFERPIPSLSNTTIVMHIGCPWLNATRYILDLHCLFVDISLTKPDEHVPDITIIPSSSNDSMIPSVYS